MCALIQVNPAQNISNLKNVELKLWIDPDFGNVTDADYICYAKLRNYLNSVEFVN